MPPPCEQPPNEPRTALLDLLARYAYQYRPDQPFRLASGRTSPEYIDCKLALSRPEAMVVLGRLIHDRLGQDVTAAGGLTMGSDPLAMATAQWSAQTAHPVRWFSVRKESKDHGHVKAIEGCLSPGDRVAVLDDVATSGGSTIKALERCRNAGLEVVQAIVLIDREVGGLEAIQKALGGDASAEAIFTKSEVRQVWERTVARQE